MMKSMGPEGYKAVIEFWVEHQELLKTDVKDRFFPKSLWSAAISCAISEDGGYEYERSNVMCAVITEYLINLISTQSHITMKDAYGFFANPECMQNLTAIMKGQEELYMFMHRPDIRPCKCMQYVATAAEIGRLRKKEMRVRTNVEHCAVCEAALARPKVCSLCKEVAYCNVEHQKVHWKLHKKECTGRISAQGC